MRGKANLTGKLYLRIFFPTLLIQVINALSSLLDFVIPGQFFGELALSAITLTMPLLLLVTAFADMISLGGSGLFSRELGKGNSKGARRYFTASMLAALLGGALITAAGLVFLDPLVRLLGADDAVFAAARRVTAFTLFLFPVMGIYLSFSYFVRNDGKPSLAMAADIVFMVSNLLLDILLTGYSSFGVAGSIAASIAAAMLSLAVLSAVFFMKQSNLRFSRAPQFSDILAIVRGGYGLTFQSVYEGIAAGAFNNAIMRALGANGLVLFSVINYVQEILRSVSFSIRDTVQPMLSTYIGERRPDAMRRVMKLSLKIGTVLSAFMLAVLDLLPPGAYALFGITLPELLAGASMLTRRYAPIAPAVFFTAVYISYYQFLEFPRLSFVMLLIQQLALRLPAGLLGLKLGGITGLILGLVAAEYLTAALCILISRLYARRQHPPLSPLLLLPDGPECCFAGECFATVTDAMELLERFRAFLTNHRIPGRIVNRSALAAEELCINVCQHSQTDNKRIIELYAEVLPEELSVYVRDDSRPFDLITFQEQSPQSVGYGLKLVRHSAASVEYISVLGLNRTVLKFPLTEEHGSSVFHHRME